MQNEIISENYLSYPIKNGMYQLGSNTKIRRYYQDGTWFRFKKQFNGTIDLFDLKSQPNLINKVIKRIDF